MRSEDHVYAKCKANVINQFSRDVKIIEIDAINDIVFDTGKTLWCVIIMETWNYRTAAIYHKEQVTLLGSTCLQLQWNVI